MLELHDISTPRILAGTAAQRNPFGAAAGGGASSGLPGGRTPLRSDIRCLNHRDGRVKQVMAALGTTAGLAQSSGGGKVAAILRRFAKLCFNLSGRSAPKD